VRDEPHVHRRGVWVRGIARACGLIACLFAARAFAHRAKAPPCTGDFVAAVELLPVTGGRAIVAIDNERVAIGGACPATKARIKTTRHATSVRAAWLAGACGGAPGRVRLRATIAAGCSLLTGTLVVGRSHEALRGAPSVCGDGITDPDIGEQCDGGGCGPGAFCAKCTCVPITVGTTTTTTPGTTTTSTTLCATLQSSCTSTAPCCSPGVCVGGSCCAPNGQLCQDSTDCCSGCCDENQSTCAPRSGGATCL
jgi:hypothetical protein